MTLTRILSLGNYLLASALSVLHRILPSHTHISLELAIFIKEQSGAHTLKNDSDVDKAKDCHWRSQQKDITTRQTFLNDATDIYALKHTYEREKKDTERSGRIGTVSDRRGGEGRKNNSI